ncbi:tetratricopeptide repeat protein [Gemmatimonadota bacterium]
MQRPPIRKKSGIPYWVRFTLVMLGFGGFTSTFVLVVLPKRFILQAGLIESGITFENEDLPFLPPVRRPEIRPTHPATPVDGVGVGPSEQFWTDVLPLLEAEDFDAALSVFSDYLNLFPDDMDVWREYAVALVRAERGLEAEAALRRLIESGDSNARLELARLQRDRGDVDQAIALFREIIADNPGDSDLRLELARSLVWAEQYEEAISLYRELATESPRALPIRLEFAQALFWYGRSEEAFFLLSGYPSHDSAWPSVEQLMAEIVPLVAPQVLTLAEMIQQAIDGGNLQLAAELYARLLARIPIESTRWNEWVDFLQYQAEDLEAARLALMSRDSFPGLDPDQRFRLAQLHVWTRHEDLAKDELLGLLSFDPDRADAWVLLGDIYRWEGDRLRAQNAYRRALALSENNEEALFGLSEIREQVDLAVSERDPKGVNPELAYFQDSDDFSRLDVAVRAAMRWYTTGLVVKTGYRRMDGPGSGGALGEENGPFAEVELVQWWRLGTIRTSVTAGVQRFETLGNEPAFNAQVEVPDAGGTALQVAYAHGPAYAHTATLVSMQGAGVRSDDIQISAYRGLGERWSIAGTAGIVSLRGGGVDNWRLSSAATATGQLSRFLLAGVTSRILTHTEAAPLLAARRLYWDPRAFWTNALLFELRTPDGNVWTVFGRVTPGVALARERDVAGTQFVPQFSTEAGAAYEKGRISVAGDVAYNRGRAGDYNSFAANLRLSIRP